MTKKKKKKKKNHSSLSLFGTSQRVAPAPPFAPLDAPGGGASRPRHRCAGSQRRRNLDELGFELGISNIVSVFAVVVSAAAVVFAASFAVVDLHRLPPGGLARRHRRRRRGLRPGRGGPLARHGLRSGGGRDRRCHSEEGSANSGEEGFFFLFFSSFLSLSLSPLYPPPLLTSSSSQLRTNRPAPWASPRRPALSPPPSSGAPRALSAFYRSSPAKLPSRRPRRRPRPRKEPAPRSGARCAL